MTPNAQSSGTGSSEQTYLSRMGLPLTPYDLLGYLIPGASFLIIIFLYESWGAGISSKFHTPLKTALHMCMGGESDKFGFTALFLLSMVTMAYVIAHVISSVSSFVIDQVLVAKGYGYPYQVLLNIKDDDSCPHNTGSGAFYRGLIFWVNLALLFYYSSLFSSYYFPDTTASTIFVNVGHIITAFFVIASILKIVLSSRQFAGKAGTEPCSWYCRFLKNAFALPYDLLARFLARYLNTRTPFEETFIKLYKVHFKNTFQVEADASSTNNHWFPYMHVRSSSAIFGQLVDNWLRLYSFARNLSAAFYIAFIYVLISLWSQKDILTIGNEYHAKVALWLPLLYWSVAIIMLLRYYYLYARYYTKFIFRSFVYLCVTNKSSAATPNEMAGGPPL